MKEKLLEISSELELLSAIKCKNERIKAADKLKLKLLLILVTSDVDKFEKEQLSIILNSISMN